MSHMKWPPVVARTDILGEVRDVNGRNVPRDIGRPVYLGGHTFYVFGDSFCRNDHQDFVGVTNNTIAYVPDLTRPTACQYLERQPLVSPFIPHTASEAQYDHHGKGENKRVTCWTFGGIIEDQPDSRAGWVFFDKIYTHGGDMGPHCGMGVCRVSLFDDHNIRAERVMGDTMIFGPDEPKFGSVTHFCEDGWVYLMGTKDPKPPFDMRTHWARIRRDADFTKRGNYEFLLANGSYGQWSGKHDDLKRIEGLDVQAQGAIVKCPELAPPGKPYLWFGVNKFMTGHLFVGCSAKLEEGWEIKSVGSLPRLMGDKSPLYAGYPHLSASRTNQGQMLCSWTDATQMGGCVFMAYFNFETEGHVPMPPPPTFVQQPAQQGSHHGHGVMGKLKGLFN